MAFCWIKLNEKEHRFIPCRLGILESHPTVRPRRLLPQDQMQVYKVPLPASDSGCFDRTPFSI